VDSKRKETNKAEANALDNNIDGKEVVRGEKRDQIQV
jgi:hypothetical protein